MTFKRITLPTLIDPSPEMYDEYVNRNKPVLIKESLHWKLLKEFSFDKITHSFGNNQYTTIVSNNGIWDDASTYAGDDLYNCASVKPQERKLSMLSVDVFIQRALNPNKFPQLHFDNEIMYLITGIPKTLKNELEPELNFIKNKKLCPTFWMSTAGSITQTHYDAREGLLVQIMGTKKVILFDRTLDLFQAKNTAKVSSTGNYLDFVDEEKKSLNLVTNPELATEKEFPGLANISGYECILTPGDILYIPFGWWHYVRTLDFSISLNLSFQIVDYLSIELAKKLIAKIPRAYYKIIFKHD